jgi:hypothetical protein
MPDSTQPQYQFLDVDAMLDDAVASARPQVPRVFFFVGGLMLVLMASAYLAPAGVGAGKVVEVLFPLLALGLIVATLVSSMLTVRRHRAEARQLEAIEEFVQLRNWPGAAMALEGLLRGPRPPRNPAVRVHGLIFLAVVLARHGRFTDAIRVHDFLLERVALDPGTDYGLRIGRAMAMLREDHLFDADRAINELRRLGQRAAGGTGDAAAGLTLVEMYRDVKTGHPGEAIELFENRQVTLRDRLGHRLADACALAARAYDALGRFDEARSAWHRATLLAPAIELTRRYPELVDTATKYEPAVAPVGM